MISHEIKIIWDHPKKGIKFHDITPVLANSELRHKAISFLANEFKNKVDTVVAIDALGFIIGAMVADRLGVSFVPIRKPNKLPRATISTSYSSEYASNELHIHSDALSSRNRVLLIDDVLGSGGTCLGAIKLCEKLGATVVGAGFLLELTALNGRGKLDGYLVKSCGYIDGEV
ncbi:MULTISPECIES: adenine phosphoribosyltransferase [unclassified Brenneria]|uniref:adenine phosphoribosyltransferase n=1 Tax=unclassified Brenneria TaxID=2634434 RepID=UPI0015548EA5|nr:MULTISPECIES: adenine phosphoribosyltransferase [unclassified Brenneria]MBJ7221436.1 adenine phosphoribosyltransferase [Brenneria sp. L3-3C-1]MEE3642679.1 adenine phosphoribosyltransferase [Brenneria sp. L3_3C_1]MEE3652592.1 adenine phosphoribosyltransferase [Brenneria sp. HEZEL_4_2_4]NPD02549.1 adenine phosphoribosyltransferase [Brenneria sp. hezel4-2-4]